MSCIKPLNFLIDLVETNSPSGSEQDILDTLQLFLDKGFTADTGSINLCCTCTLDYDFPYFFGDGGMYNRFAEGVGISTTLQLQENFVTEGPIPAGAFIQIVNYVAGDNFIPFVDNTKDKSGTPNTNGFYFYSNSIVNWSNGTTLFYSYQPQFNPSNCVRSSGCCTNIFASIETFSKFCSTMALLTDNNPNIGIPIEKTCLNLNCCDLRKKIDEYSELLKPDILNMVLDLGIFEIGDTNIGEILEYFVGKSDSFIYDYLREVLSKGVVANCTEDITLISGVERFLKYTEAVG